MTIRTFAPASGDPASGDSAGVAADLHLPESTPRALVILAHGAGGDRNAAILRAYTEELATHGLAAARIDLPYRQRRPKGPPSPSTAAADRDGIRAAAALLREEAALGGLPLILGGHSYGGRQASMVAAEDPTLADGLLLSSYPLHPPGKPEKLRTEHLPQITAPTVIVHGSSDPFATATELADAAALFAGPVHIVEIEKTGHALGPDKKPTAPLAVAALLESVLVQ